jgi:hypothetical protein
MEGEHESKPEGTSDGASTDGASVEAATPPTAAAPQPPAPPAAPPPYVPPQYGAPAPPTAPPPYAPPQYGAPSPPPAAPPAYAPPQYGAPAPPPGAPQPYAPPQYGAPAPPPGAPQPYAPPAYTPQYGAAAPPASPVAPGAPPGYAPYSPAPMPVQPGFGQPPPPAAKKGGSRVLLIVGIVAVFLILVLAGGAIVANASLSSTYSPKRAVSDYLAAQARGDVNAMMLGATFTSPDSTSSQFFTKDAVAAMMGMTENKSISSVSVTSSQDLDSSTSKVAVSMSWNNTQRTQTYTVRKDTSRMHDLFYYSWRVDIPSTSISVTLPNQPGAIVVDAIKVTSPAAINVIQGYHTVTMQSTSFYDEASQTANGVDGAASVAFTSKMGANALAAAGDSVKAAFNNVTCDAAKFFDCPSHAYKVPAGYYDTLPAPGGDIRANTSWTIVFAGDPTTAMKLVIGTDNDKVTASGTCAMKLTVDGSKIYNFTGTWTGTLTWANSGFASDLTLDCDATRA